MSMKPPVGSTNMPKSARPSPRDVSEIVGNWRSIRAEMDRALRDAGRAPSDAALLCVSKTRPIADIEPLLAAGARRFGENRVQEAQAKWTEPRERYRDIELHLIGPLQTNKIDDAIALFDVVETLDRPRLAEAFAARVARGVRLPELYAQINTGDESQKTGITPAEADVFLQKCREEYKIPVTGLMCIPPVADQAAPHFALLARIAQRNGIDRLSMGMTNDFQIALQLGSTQVRIGSALFGVRV
jgi:pyridoxal phosphate enzyme (YggS family)